MAPACWALRLLAAAGLQTVCRANPPTAHPQGLGPQHLWPTPAVLVVPSSHGGSARWHTALAKHVRLEAVRHGANGAWRYPGADFLESCRSAGDPLAAAAKHLQRLIEETAAEYFRKALGREPSLVQRLHLSVKESWASAAFSTAMPWQEPHVHPKVALSGVFYLECGGIHQEHDNLEECGLYLQDPRPPAGMTEVPESLRKKLGWGEASQVRVRAGSLLLHPAWLYHAGLPLSDALESSNDTEGSPRLRTLVSFTVAVQLLETVPAAAVGTKDPQSAAREP